MLQQVWWHAGAPHNTRQWAEGRLQIVAYPVGELCLNFTPLQMCLNSAHIERVKLHDLIIAPAFTIAAVVTAMLVMLPKGVEQVWWHAGANHWASPVTLRG